MIKHLLPTVALLLLLPSAAFASDAQYLSLAAHEAPTMAIERGTDAELPVDFRTCRAVACAERSTHPVLFVHAVRLGGFLYLEYWEYEPDSQFAHTGIAFIDGYHRDDWEGVIVKLRRDGTPVGARATAHLSFNGRHPWWDLTTGDWAQYPATVYRAAGSHAGGFAPAGVDLAGDAWNGTARLVRPGVVAADTASRARATFDSDAVAPWRKLAWGHPEAVITGRPGDQAAYAFYARLWATICRC